MGTCLNEFFLLLDDVVSYNELCVDLRVIFLHIRRGKELKKELEKRTFRAP
jgi:hypothetical protein